MSEVAVTPPPSSAAAPVTPTPTPPPAPPPKPAARADDPAPASPPPAAPAEPTADWSRSPQERFAAKERELAASDPWRSGPDTVLSRDSQGRLLVNGKLAGDVDPGSAPDPATAEPAADKPKIRIGDSVNGFEATDDEIKQWRATHEALESRKLTTPASADLYEIKLSPDFKAPAAFADYKPQADHPLMGQARAFAHEVGLTQDQFSRMLSLNAAKEIGTAQMLEAARDREVAKLGANGVNRVTAVENFIAAQVGEKKFAAIRPLIATASMVEVLETWLQQSLNGTGSRFSASRGAENRTATVDDATWAKMSYHERKEYASKFGR
jgi:hypothetical protein